MDRLRRIGAFGIMNILIFGFIMQSVHANDAQDQAYIESAVSQLRTDDTTLPGSVTEQKGMVGSLLSRLFDNAGKIKFMYIDISDIYNNLVTNQLVRFNGTGFVQSTIRDNGSVIGVGGGVNPSFIANFVGNVNVTGNITSSTAPTDANHLANKAYVDSNSSIWSLNGANEAYYNTAFVGIGNTNPNDALDVTGNLDVSGAIQSGDRTAISAGTQVITARRNDDTRYGYLEVRNNSNARGAYFGYGNGGSTVNLQIDAATELDINGGDVDFNNNRLEGVGDPDSGDDAMDRDYADARFVNVGEAIDGDTITDGTIDSSEIQDGTITGTDILNSTITTSDILNNTITASDIGTDAVNSNELAAGSVRSSEIFDGAVTAADMGSDSVGTSEVIDNSLTAADLGTNSVGNDELINNPTFTSIQVTGTPSGSNDATNKAYVDNLVQGIVWKGPSATSAAGTHGACNSSKEGWATYNLSDNAVYVCNGTAWVNIGNTAVIPNATTTSPGQVQLSGVLNGTYNNVGLANNSVGTAQVAVDSLTSADLANGSVNSAEIVDGSVRTQEIANNTITETDIADSFIARNSEKTRTIDVRTMPGNTTSASNYDPSTTEIESNGISSYFSTGYPGGSWRSALTVKGWSGAYGAWQLAGPSSTTASVNDEFFLRSGSAGSWNTWNEIWHAGNFDKDNIPGDSITDGTIDSTEIENNTIAAVDLAIDSVGSSEIASQAVRSDEIYNNTITASDLATNSVGNAELIDAPTVTNLNVAAGNYNGINLWNGSTTYSYSMANTADHSYGPVTNYGIKATTSNTAGRGFTWGVKGATPTVGIEATTGNAQFAGNVTANGLQVNTNGVVNGSLTVGLENPVFPGGDGILKVRANLNRSQILMGPHTDEDYYGIEANLVQGGMRFRTSNTERVRIQNNGNVGIGTTNPGARLSVVESSSSLTVPKFIVGRSETEAFKMYVSDNDGILSYEQDETTGSHDMRFNIASPSSTNSEYNFQFNGTTRMMVREDGNVGIGTSSASERLHVNGNVLATAYFYSSDETLKKDISTIENPLETIGKLRGVDFTWKENDKKDVGFIAQEMEQVLPELVSTSEETGLKSVQYGNIVAVVVEAIKEIIKDVKGINEANEAQQQEIDELKAELEEIKKILNK